MSTSVRNPDGIQASREGAQPRGPSPALPQTTAPSLPSLGLTGEGGGDQLSILVGKGVSAAKAQQLISRFDADRIRQAVAYFDQQTPGSVGGGVLVKAVEEGRAPAVRRASLVDQQTAYAAQICEWIRRNLPELDRPVHGPHPAAAATVIRLHYQNGRGALTKAAHGAEIRAAVKAFDAKWMEPPMEGAVS